MALPHRPRTHRGTSEEPVLQVLRRSQQQGFLGPGDILAHVEHARAHGRAATPGAGERWCDIGSGGGVPGLIFATDFPGVKFVLLDRSQRRTEFLADAVRDLGLSDRTVVLTGDASDIARHMDHRHAYDGVVSRAFGSPAAVAECSVGLLRLSGRLIVSEPPGADTSRWPETPLHQLGLVHRGMSGTTPRFAVLERTAETSTDYPRPWKQIRKRPLF
ncbi:RsmG family class I SAM-dependent methyltransferase [Candidatus Poriferisodalis sp.]|uniref:RsmG family class I SAM-dependent methyltransferase n=1 Tax=Candidatus Poriferisodalis sp. TaxID=3101277 RepID=UPI003D10D0A9